MGDDIIQSSVGRNHCSPTRCSDRWQMIPSPPLVRCKLCIPTRCSNRWQTIRRMTIMTSMTQRWCGISCHAHMTISWKLRDGVTIPLRRKQLTAACPCWSPTTSQPQERIESGAINALDALNEHVFQRKVLRCSKFSTAIGYDDDSIYNRHRELAAQRND